MTADDPFFEPYDRSEIAYGETPSAPLAAYIAQVDRRGCVYDLGAGAGRDTLALARAGFDVTAVDLSARGLERIVERAESQQIGDRVKTMVSDVREVVFPEKLDGIVATTVLDHIPAHDARPVWERMVAALDEQAFLYVEVHTTEDPGSDQEPGASSDAPVSETAGAVINYFQPNQLVGWATEPEANLRILRYEERLEWDLTHGPEHLHGKAVLIAVRRGFHPSWYGQPPAFPRR